MTEDYLHYVWKYKKFIDTSFVSTHGETINIIRFGDYNTDAGPDFFNCQIKINNQTWVGNIEIHVNSSDWKKHGHHKNAAYNNVVLHVVYNNDAKCETHNGRTLTTLELKKYFNHSDFIRYQKIIQSDTNIPCSKQTQKISKFTLANWIERCAIERLEEKSKKIEQLLIINNNDWEETCYQLLARNFGFNINADAFQLLTKNVPLIVAQKNSTTIKQTEALFLGAAGLLNESYTDNYIVELQKEYKYLQKKLRIASLEKSIWKFARMRPANFPSIRIVQFATLIHKHPRLFSVFLETKNIKSFKSLFNILTSEYWDEHYLPNKLSAKLKKRVGESSIQNIIINSVAPLLFVYGKKTDNSYFSDKAIKLLESVPNEENKHTNAFLNIGISCKTALDSQALIHLKKYYCDKKKCLECAIGHHLLTTNKEE